MTLPPEYTARPGAHGEVQGPQLQEWIAEIDGVPIGSLPVAYERPLKARPYHSGEATYRIRYTGPADPRVAIASVLSKLGKNFTVEELDA